MNWQKESFQITTDKTRLDIGYIHHYLSNESYWSPGIPREIVQKAIEGSLCFGLFDGTEPIGFGRVITDSATFAYLADVFVAENYRGRGLGKWLISVILNHPDLQSIRSWMLMTRDAHSLYSGYGFKPLEDPSKLMRRHHPDAYKKQIS